MRIFHIYTDASSKDTSMFLYGVKRTTKVGVIVVNSNIVDIYYNRVKKYFHSHYAERDAIKESIYYVRNKYNAINIIVHTDDRFQIGKFTNKKGFKNVKFLYVKGHCSNRRGLKYKFNCLADWISRNGINTWKEYYYRHLLK